MDINYKPLTKIKNYISISMMPGFQRFSFEELRYMQDVIKIEPGTIKSEPGTYFQPLNDYDENPRKQRKVGCKNRRSDGLLEGSVTKSKKARLDRNVVDLNKSLLNSSSAMLDEVTESINRSYKRIIVEESGDEENVSVAAKRARTEEAKQVRLSHCLRRRLHKKKLVNNVDVTERTQMETMERLKKNGNELVRAGRFSEACGSYEQALAINTKFHLLRSVVWSNLAHARMQLDDWEGGLAACEAACNKTPDQEQSPAIVKASLRRVRCLVELQRLEEAETTARLLKDELMRLDSSELGNECQKLLVVVQRRKERQWLLHEADKSSAAFLDRAQKYVNDGYLEDDDRAIVISLTKALFGAGNPKAALRSCTELLDPTIVSGEDQNMEPASDWSPLTEADKIELLEVKTRCLLQLQRPEEAVETAKVLLALTPRAPAARQLLTEAQQAVACAVRSASDPYAVLGLQQGATADQIKSAYRKMSRVCHPDKLVGCTDPCAKARQEDRFKAIKAAYETLSDPITKRQHDIKRGRAAAGNYYW